MRQLLTEAILLAGTGTLIGVVIASWVTRVLVGMLGNSRREVSLDLSLDGKVLAFAAATCIATVVLFALVPAWRATRVDPQLAMKAGGRGTAEGYNRFRIGKGLVIAQSALAFVLVVGAGLLVTTFARLTTSNIGFEPEGVLVAQVRLGGTSIPATQRGAVLERMQRQIEATPGVQSVSSADLTPVSGSAWNDEVVVDGDPVTDRTPAIPWFNETGVGYFRTMRTRLIAGRDFGPQDTPTSPKVAIVNEAVVKQIFKGASPIGRSYHTRAPGRDGERTTIIGVVEDSRYQSMREEAQPIIYTTNLQAAQRGAITQLLIRTGTGAPAVAGAVKSIAAAMDPGILLKFSRLDDQISESLQREKALALLSGFFGALALLLAMMGLYGVLAYTLARRRVEIGIRIALGAARARVIRMVLGDVALLIGAGVVIGGAIAYASGKVLASLLYGVEARDPVTLAGSAVLLGALAFMAAAIPARRAASLEPVEALRED
jgi:predicted permease